MGTSDYNDMDYRSYKKTVYIEAARVRRAVFFWRLRTWALVAAIVAAPAALLIWMLWSMR
jgi:hypothetical protein